METYPYPTPDGIIDLVRKSECDRIKWDLEEQKAKYTADVAELNERLTKQQSDMLDTIVKLRAELTRWEALAGQMAEALDDCNTKLVGWHGLYPSQVCADDEAAFQSADKALAAYEAATSTTGKPETTQ